LKMQKKKKKEKKNWNKFWSFIEQTDVNLYYLKYLSTIAELHVQAPSMNQVILRDQDIKSWMCY
jgi:hypothetical protein